ncbi:MAG: M48 family metallopeptidase [Sphingobacteriales bacterium]|nr:MAG: M48 family metallopeptidase [Sphingobacteriales bacterium]
MKKLTIQFVVFVAGFFALWLALSQVDWLTLFKVAKLSKAHQKELGTYVLNAYNFDKKQLSDSRSQKIIADLKNRICLANQVDIATIQTYIFHDAEVNAFAMPGGNVIVNTALISYCDNPDMLAGVLAHEIAHVQKEHVNKKLIRNIGMSSLLLLAGGSQNAGVIKRILQTLTTSSFDRDDEREADRVAVSYLQQTKIDPLPLAAFFAKMDKHAGAAPDLLDWVSTHPDAAERAASVRNAVGSTNVFRSSIDSASWTYLQQQCR